MTQEQFNALSQCVDVASGDDDSEEIIQVNHHAVAGLGEILRQNPHLTDAIGVVRAGVRHIDIFTKHD